jgi:hypothetical protein
MYGFIFILQGRLFVRPVKKSVAVKYYEYRISTFTLGVLNVLNATSV